MFGFGTLMGMDEPGLNGFLSGSGRNQIYARETAAGTVQH